MLAKLKNRNEGFTIIEVLIVLAIAGLIMLVVFLAVPQLQRNQRNNARNSDGSRVSAAVTECLANRNNVATATTGCGVAANISTGELSQLSTAPAVVVGGTTAPTFSKTQAGVWFQRKCLADGSGVDTAANSDSKDFAVLYQLEKTNTATIDRCVGVSN